MKQYLFLLALHSELMPSYKPIRKIYKKTNNELLVYSIKPIPRKFQEIINTLRHGPYNTRYDLNRFYAGGTVSNFIKVGLDQGFLKQKWVLVGTRPKALLELVY